jgi:hypothetical protein
LKQFRTTKILRINPLAPVSAAVAASKAARVNPDRPTPDRAVAVSGNAELAFSQLKTGDGRALRFTAR